MKKEKEIANTKENEDDQVLINDVNESGLKNKNEGKKGDIKEKKAKRKNKNKVIKEYI